MSGQVVRLDRDGPVARVTLDRPQVHNAFDERLIAQLHDAFTGLGRDEGVRLSLIHI